MQSRSQRPAHRSNAFVFFAAILPLAGYLAELLTGMFAETGCQLFPTPWYAAAIGLAVLLNLLLHLGVWLQPRQLPLRAAAVGYVSSVIAMTALAALPQLPVIVFMFLVLLGVLAFAPFWAGLGLLALWPDLLLRWLAAGLPRHRLLVLVLPSLLVAPVCVTAHRLAQRHTAALLQTVASAPDMATARAAAAELRALPLARQLELCDSERPEAWLARGDAGFWFVDSCIGPWRLDADAARRAFYRVHARPWTWYARPGALARTVDSAPDDGWRPPPFLELRRSTLLVTAETAAAVARIDWQLQFANSSRRPLEVELDLELPAGAVASGLSLWIGGSERPAAFGSVDSAQRAYDRVVARRRDPALLREVAPGQLRLSVFPVAANSSDTRVRVLLTAPLAQRGDRAWLQLPLLRARDCQLPSRHDLTIVDGERREQRLVATAAMATQLQFAAATGPARCTDAEGALTQQLIAMAPTALPQHLVVVVDGSPEFAAAGDAALAALPAEVDCTLFVAEPIGFARYDGRLGDAALRPWLAAKRCEGGIDAVPALLAACEASTDDGMLLWLCGRQQAVCASPARLDTLLQRRAPLATLVLGDAPNLLRRLLGDRAPALPRTGDLAADLQWLCTHAPVNGAAEPFAGHRRQFTREAAGDATPVSDQMARLWAAQRARQLRAQGDAAAAARLAARYRLVAAGAAAVVLETREQYAQNELDPGAALGSEPPEPIGGGPVPELPVWMLVATGLLLLWLRRRR